EQSEPQRHAGDLQEREARTPGGKLEGDGRHQTENQHEGATGVHDRLQQQQAGNQRQRHDFPGHSSRCAQDGMNLRHACLPVRIPRKIVTNSDYKSHSINLDLSMVYGMPILVTMGDSKNEKLNRLLETLGDTTLVSSRWLR